jgi:hypothetical protein
MSVHPPRELVDPGTNVPYATRARALFEWSDAQRLRGNVDGAAEGYWLVRRRFVLTAWGRRAELALADVALARGDYVRAAVGYQQYVRNHPASDPSEIQHAQTMLAQCEARNGTLTAEQIASEQVREATERCTAGDSDRCTELGDRFEHGRGVPPDDLRAATFYRQGCDAGDARGCYDLAQFASAGRGLPRDAQVSSDLLYRACEGGYPNACDDIGRMYLDAGPQRAGGDRVAAMMVRQCDHGLASACTTAGRMYILGRNVVADVTRGQSLLQRACEQGEQGACADARRTPTPTAP